MEGDKRGGSVAESERPRSVLYEYVPVISGASVYFSHCMLGQSNVSSMTLITKVSQFIVPSMEAHCTCMCMYVHVHMSCFNTLRQYLRPTQKVDLDPDKYVSHLCVELW